MSDYNIKGSMGKGEQVALKAYCCNSKGEILNFYLVDYAAHMEAGWPWAGKLYPHPCKTGTLCPLCGKGILYPGRYPAYPITAGIEGGTAYPDVLGCSNPLFVVSQSVISDWEAANVTGYKQHPFLIVRAKSSDSDLAMLPRYYHIEVTGRCQIDLEAMGIEVTFYCPTCGYRKEERIVQNEVEDDPFDIYPFVIREETWDGSDLFVSELFERNVFCSQKVFDLAGLNERTNFEFKLPENYAELESNRIDYIAAAHKKFAII